METVPTVADPMAGRISRFRDMKSHGVPVMFIDSVLPGHLRMNYSVIGATASENPNFQPMLTDEHRFGIGMFEAPPGNGPAWHTHEYVELFVPLTGRWRFYYGYDGEKPEALAGEATLEPWDVISFPPGLWRGFENVSAGSAWGFAVLDPFDPFRSKDPIWPAWVARRAAEKGLASDERGRMVVPANFGDLELEVSRQLKEAGVIADNVHT